METNNETVEQVYSSCENVMVWDFPGGPMEYARRFLTAHKREIAAKDEEIADLKDYISDNDINGDAAVACLMEIKEAAEEKMAEIAKLRALVKELADALDESNRTECEHYCKCSCSKGDKNNGCETMCKNRALVAKAREVRK